MLSTTDATVATIFAMPPTADEVQRQLDDGAWLKPGAVGVLFGVSRFTVDDWLKAGRIGYRKTVGGQRECDPDDVRALLAERQRVHRDGGSDTGP